MNKKILSANEIQRLLQFRVNLIREIVEDKANIKVPMPYWHEVDENGVNWDINTLPNAVGYVDQIVAVIESLKREANLKQS